MSDDIKTSSMLVHLDDLLDTRLSVLYAMNQRSVQMALSGNYFSRMDDKFPGVTLNAFKERYAKRTKSDLVQAKSTPIVKMVKSFVQETIRNNLDSPFCYRPKVFVNTYPYKLTESESTIIVKTLVGVTSESCDVEVVHIPMEGLTPSFVKQNLSVMVMYHYADWLEHFSKGDNGFRKTRCPDTCLIGPSLFFNGEPKKEELRQIQVNTKMSPFDMMEESAAALIQLKLHDVIYFSVDVHQHKA